MRFVLLTCILFFPASAFANVGMPLLFHLSTWQILFLIPIIIIEAVVLYKYLSISYFKALLATSGVNILSTIVGTIFLFPAMFFPTMYTFNTQSALLTLVLLIPFYLISAWVEYRLLKPVFNNTALKGAVFKANQISYFMLAVFLLSTIVKGYIVNGYFV